MGHRSDPAAVLRRWFCLLLVPAGMVLAAVAPTPLAILAELASDLSQGDPVAAIGMFDSGMAGFGRIEANIRALAAQTDVSCAIEIVSDEETGGVHKLDLDWLMTLKSQGDEVSVERRRERVQIEMKQVKGKWKITAFSPAGVLNPIQVR